MKNMIAAFCALILSSPAFAANYSKSSLKHIALCAMEQYDEEVSEDDFATISEIDVQELNSLNPFLLNLVNIHLQHQEYTTTDLTFEEIKELFTEGEYKYDDLYIISFQVKSTGRIYYHVKSYPGDNPYGLIFTLDGKLVATNQDDSISLFVGNKGEKVYCGNL